MKMSFLFFLFGYFFIANMSRDTLPQFGEPFTQAQADQLLAKQRETHEKNLIILKEKLKE